MCCYCVANVCLSQRRGNVSCITIHKTWGVGLGEEKKRKEQKGGKPCSVPIACIVPGQRNHEMHGRCPHMSALNILFFIFITTK